MTTKEKINELLLAGLPPAMIKGKIPCSISCVWRYAGILYREAGVTNQAEYIAKHYARAAFNSARGE